VHLAVGTGGVTGVDALEDDRQLPVAEGKVEIEFGDVAAGALGVAAGELGPGREAGGQVCRLAERDPRLAAIGPVGHQGADVV